ncbi:MULTISPECIES: Fe-S cluster assembly protein SufD [Bacillus]|jgi:Fe-S cluster assembly protein SufD|uniref:Fe-S cluster assembly protein SufD n=1 Tax=Bacillus velezensis (strain DSM 23117 / BGSC 10A6 / LMG 26770 / FZB42) TaxID=326423 RepID=A7Z8I3_BACVZ|nr:MULTISPECIES: Fe-S cluster assembly protein SufD [Bacillus]APH37051.1 Fe-S cluster assembly protein SufD [Bacillus subtilis]ARM29098.1 Fe-S cluster assembly protein SufD [Bacillus vallismortis]ABS75309.1 Fe-S cluster assembly protein SufD [Bacillus velezensis FZB42]AGZ57784.1 feS assembly protein SufD [Bacillus amyloliquefaciens CC178]AMQ69002.1 Fe-S cluster assembly protein SufD [Bacillus amyloliquefaciens UMAF6639]
MTLETKLSVDQEYVKGFSEKHQEPAWLKNLRLQALEKAEDLPLPKPDKTKITNWNFTKFNKHTVENAPLASLEDLADEAKALIDIENEDKTLYVQRDQTPAFLSLSKELKDKGVIFTDILTAAREHSDLVEKYFMKDGVKVDEHKLTALHAALMNGGAFLYVPKNVQVETPVQAVYVHESNDTALFNHVLIVAEDHSSVTYVENYISTVNPKEAVFNIISEVVTGDNASVTYGAVDNLSAGVTTYVNRRGAARGRDSRIEWALGLMNDGDTISENTTNLYGDGTYGDTKTVVVGRGEQTENFTTQIIHFGKASEGYILKHGVMKDAASSIFNGIGKIEHGASKANAEQESRVLMLSEKARGDANPILLIDEDDVTAGHAASVGRVDPIQLYYLMSRGIPKEEAERLVIYGFLAPVVKELPIEGVKKQLVSVIERKVK